MIKDIIENWEKRKDVLRKELEKRPIFNYTTLIKKIVEVILNYDKVIYNIENMTVIDDGDYQGTIIYIIPEKTYQPDVNEYIYTSLYYGSCSSCDTIQEIEMNYFFSISKETYDTVINDLMMLSLHIIQKFKRLGDSE